MGKCLHQDPVSGSLALLSSGLVALIWSPHVHELTSLQSVILHHCFWPLSPLTLLLPGSVTKPFWVDQLTLIHF